MLLFINEIDFKAFGPFNDVDGTDVKLLRATFRSYNRKNALDLIKLTFFIKIISNHVAEMNE